MPLDFESSFVGRGVEASSSIFMSFKLVGSKELSATMESLMESKSTPGKALMASIQKPQSHNIVLVQEISKFTGHLELFNDLVFRFTQRGPDLVNLLLEMVQKSILFDDVRL